MGGIPTRMTDNFTFIKKNHLQMQHLYFDAQNNNKLNNEP